LASLPRDYIIDTTAAVAKDSTINTRWIPSVEKPKKGGECCFYFNDFEGAQVATARAVKRSKINDLEDAEVATEGGVATESEGQDH
jgi:hypothetical protein